MPYKVFPSIIHSMNHFLFNYFVFTFLINGISSLFNCFMFVFRYCIYTCSFFIGS